MAELSSLQPPEGLYFDELSKIRLLDTDKYQQTEELREQCQVFVEKIEQFQNIVGSFVGLMSDLGKAVDAEKMRAIGARNLLKSISKQREVEQQQLQALIAERQAHLERLRLQFESLQKVQGEQELTIEQLMTLN